MKNDGDDDAGSCCDDGCNLPWDGIGVVQLWAFIPISEELLSCDWLAVAPEPAVVFAHKNIQIQAEKVARQSSQKLLGREMSIIQNYVDTIKEERRRR